MNLPSPRRAAGIGLLISLWLATSAFGGIIPQQDTPTPAPVFPTGLLELVCDLKNYAAEDVACQPTIDGVPQTAIPGGMAVQVWLDSTVPHAVNVTLVGTQVAVYAPASLDLSVTVNGTDPAAPVVTQVKATFTKNGHIVVTLDQPGVVGDFYVDGVLIATQVPGLDQWVQPKVSHKIEVKALTDPGAAGQYTWKDARTTLTVKSGQDKAITVRLRKQWLVGFLNIKCNITGLPEGSGAVCIPTINDVAYDPIPTGESFKYTLAPGTYSVVIAVGPAEQWLAAPKTYQKQVSAGYTSTVTAKIKAKIAPPPPGQRAVSDRADDFGGPQLHFIYMVPADGEDRAWDVSRILDEINVMQNWMRGQTGGRSWLIDTFQGAPDVSFVQMPYVLSQLQVGPDAVWDITSGTAYNAGFNDFKKVYVIYYEGPDATGRACGVANTPGNYAVVILRTPGGPGSIPCDDPSFSWATAPHEVIHALGFMTPCVPHYDGTGHVWDNPNDLMYGGGGVWNPNAIMLDFNHDDYYNHNLSCPDLYDSPYLTPPQ